MQRRTPGPVQQTNVLRIQVRADLARAVMDLCFEVGANGAAQDANDDLDSASLTIYAEPDQLPRVSEAVEQLLRRVSPEHAWSSELVTLNDDWRLKWTEHLEPVELTADIRLVPVNPDGSDTSGGSSSELYLETGLVFGFGEHPTTRMAVRWLELVVKGQEVLDFGTGSGVLALVAERLGAKYVLGVDNDRESVRVAQRNAQRNAARASEFALTPLESVERSFGVVVANVDAVTLGVVAPLLCARLRQGGQLGLTGVLLEQQSALVSAYAAHGVELQIQFQEDDWVLLAGAKA